MDATCCGISRETSHQGGHGWSIISTKRGDWEPFDLRTVHTTSSLSTGKKSRYKEVGGWGGEGGLGKCVCVCVCVGCVCVCV